MAHCKDCKWWELLHKNEGYGDWGACHHPIAHANYQIWWNNHPMVHDKLASPNSEGGFEMSGNGRACEAFEDRGLCV